MGKCQVCGKQEPNTQVASSACGAISFCYCQDCLSKDLEPYSALVGMGLNSTKLSQKFKDKVLIPSLQFHNKTIEQFDEDVNKLEASYQDYINELINKRKQGVDG